LLREFDLPPPKSQSASDQFTPLFTTIQLRLNRNGKGRLASGGKTDTDSPSDQAFSLRLAAFYCITAM
jgi:hypothetical protein